MKKIQLAPGLELPADEAAAQRYSIFGKPGMGKSNFAALLVEALLEAGEQVIIVDPASIWWSLRVGRDGKTPAFDIAVMGGEHGDLPLVASGGALIANALAGSSTSAVIDLSDFTLGDQRLFVTQFFEAFFHAKKKHRSPVLVVLEEAHEFIPQIVQPGEARMFGAIKRVAKIGRNYGIGLAEIDHRPQEVSKAIVNLSEFIAAFQMAGAHERKSMKDWIANNDPDRVGLVDELPNLERGAAQVYSPSWLRMYGKFSFPLKQTYDAGKTPGRRAKSVRIKPIDLKELEKSMASLVAESAANDPKALKAEIARLKRELATKPSAVPAVKTKTVVEKVPFIPREVATSFDRLIRASDHFKDAMAKFGGGSPSVTSNIVVNAVLPPLSPAVERILSRKHTFTEPREPSVSVSRGKVSRDDGSPIGKGERLVLTAIAQHTSGVTREQLTVLTGYKRSTRDAYIQRLIAAGLVEQLNGGIIAVTEDGVAALGDDYQPLPTGDALREHWMQRLPEGERRILDVLTESYPQSASRESISEATGYKRSTRDAYLQRLAARRLVRSWDGGVVASEELFS